MKTRFCSIICVIFLLFGSIGALSSCNSDDAVGIISAEINEDGELVLIYSDGNEQNLGVVVGKMVRTVKTARTVPTEKTVLMVRTDRMV